MKMEIIPATESHVPPIIELWKEFIDYHKDIQPVYTRAEDGDIKFGEYLKESIESEKAQVLVALDKGEAIAYSIAQISKRPPTLRDVKYGFISDLGVRSDRQREGIGGLMLKKTLEWFKLHNMNRIELLVLSDNEAGVSFWRKHGFEVMTHRMFRLR
jgi:ribosomal protein S18 acetylase RimI-like enzyme